MTLMFNVERDGAGNPITGKRVYITLVANGDPGYSDNAEVSIESVGEVLTDETGRWEAELVPNSDIVPEGTIYSAKLKFRGGEFEHLFTVPDSGLDNWIGDWLTELPGVLPSGALTQHLNAANAHLASNIQAQPVGTIVATNVQSALAEVDTRITTTVSTLNATIALKASTTYVDASIATVNAAVALKANDNAVVHLAGNESIAGVKTFTSAPVVPVGSFSIASTNGLQAALDTKALDNAVVHLIGNESIAGTKTLSAASGSQTAVIAKGVASQTANIFETQSSASVVYSGFDKNGFPFNRKNAAPADADIANSELKVWWDNTPGTGGFRVKGKDSAGAIISYLIPSGTYGGPASPITETTTGTTQPIFSFVPAQAAQAKFDVAMHTYANTGGGAGTNNRGVWMGWNAGRHAGTLPVQAGKPALVMGFEDNYFDPVDGTYGSEWYVEHWSPDGVTVQSFRPFYGRIKGSNANAAVTADIIHCIGTTGGVAAGSFTISNTQGVGTYFQVTPTSVQAYKNLTVGGFANATVNVAPSSGQAILVLNGASNSSITMQIGSAPCWYLQAESTTAMRLRDNGGRIHVEWTQGATASAAITAFSSMVTISETLAVTGTSAFVLVTAAEVRTQDGTANRVRMGTRGPGGQAGFSFGSADDTNLYRAAGGQIGTDGDVVTGGTATTTGTAHEVRVNGSTATSYGARLALVGGREWNLVAQPGGATSSNFLIRDSSAGADRLKIDNNGNLNIGAGISDFGSGVKIVGVTDATTVPTTNPVGGFVLYSESGVGKVRTGATTAFMHTAFAATQIPLAIKAAASQTADLTQWLPSGSSVPMSRIGKAGRFVTAVATAPALGDMVDGEMALSTDASGNLIVTSRIAGAVKTATVTVA